MKKEKTKIFTQPPHSSLLYTASLVGSPFIFLFALYFGLEPSVSCILLIAISLTGTVFSAFHVIVNIEYAYLDDDKIIVRNLFKQILEIKWDDVETIVIRKLSLASSRAPIDLPWVVIKPFGVTLGSTAKRCKNPKAQKFLEYRSLHGTIPGDRNRTKNNYCLLYANKKNLLALKECLRKTHPNLLNNL